jgi:hypothetical protein
MSTRNLPGDKGQPAQKATTTLPSLSQLFRKCGSPDISQPYGPTRPVTEIALPNIIRGGHRILSGKPDGKRQFFRSGHSWNDHIKTNLKGEIYEYVNWIDVAQDLLWQYLMKMVMNL